MSGPEVQLQRHPAGGYSYVAPLGTHYRVRRDDVTDERGNVLKSKRRWAVLDNGNVLDCFDSLADVRRWLASSP